MEQTQEGFTSINPLVEMQSKISMESHDMNYLPIQDVIKQELKEETPALVENAFEIKDDDSEAFTNETPAISTEDIKCEQMEDHGNSMNRESVNSEQNVNNMKLKSEEEDEQGFFPENLQNRFNNYHVEMDPVKVKAREKPFACEICHKRFWVNSHVLRHMRTHTGEKPFACNICHKSFSANSSLKTHMKIHTGEKPFGCNICHKYFSLNSTLQAHIKTHTGEKPFGCTICHKDFSVKTNLRIHMKIHTGEKLFRCEICNKSFAVISYLQRHMRSHTGEKPFGCNICHRFFSVNSSLKDHMKTHCSFIIASYENSVKSGLFQVSNTRSSFYN